MASYHDLYVTTHEIPRTSIFDLPFGYMVTCTRTAGWELWFDKVVVAGEYGEGLRLDVAGVPIVDTTTLTEVK